MSAKTRFQSSVDPRRWDEYEPLQTYRRATWSSRSRPMPHHRGCRRRKTLRVVVLVVAALLGFVGASGAVALGIHQVIVAVPDGPSRGFNSVPSDNGPRLEVNDVVTEGSAVVIAIAESALVDNPYDLRSAHGQCLAFVDDVFAVAGQDFRRVCCATYAMKVAEPVSEDLTSIPVGACLFSDRSVTHTRCENCQHDAGHIGIYAGENQVIHNGLNGVELIDINDFINTWGPNGAGGAITWGWHAALPL